MTDEEIYEMSYMKAMNTIKDIRKLSRWRLLNHNYTEEVKDNPILKSKYVTIYRLIDRASKEEILEMTHEQRLTYLYLFGPNSKRPLIEEIDYID